MRFKRTVAPTFDAITLEEGRQQIKEPSNITAEDDLILEFIRTAGDTVQTKTKKVIATSTWTGYLDTWPDGSIITINKNPITTLTSVSYYNSSNVLTAMVEGTDYIADTTGEDSTASPFRIYLINKPSLYDRINAIEIVFKAGYLTPGTVDSRIKQAVRLYLTDWKENRTDYITGKIVSALPRSVEYLINQIRTDEL
jgi:uncharacterized phiE125 gp8 family phage protein